MNRSGPNGTNVFIPPACRSDGTHSGRNHPIQGMRFQLDPSLQESDFARWGLTAEAAIVAKALQKYGMFLGDNGGPMAIQAQLLAPGKKRECRKMGEAVSGVIHKHRKHTDKQFQDHIYGRARTKKQHESYAHKGKMTISRPLTALPEHIFPAADKMPAILDHSVLSNRRSAMTSRIRIYPASAYQKNS